MTRLQRLLGVRRVRLQVAARQLRATFSAEAAARETAARLTELRSELASAPGVASAQALKSGAAMAARLDAVSQRQAVRLAALAAQRTSEGAAVRHHRAAVDAVAAAIARQGANAR